MPADRPSPPPTARLPGLRPCLLCLPLLLPAMLPAAARAAESDRPPAADDVRAGDDAPVERSVTIPALEIIGFDVLWSNANRAFSGSHDYDVSWHSIEHNLRGPWVTDNDPFHINQFAHPYQGSLYHGAARSMGLSYWQAAGLTFAGSAWWEITGEKTPPSINDQVASGIAGSFLGEPLFRMAHLVYRQPSVPSGWRPWLAAAISPPVAMNRRLFGEDHYGAVFDDHDPAVYGRLRLGATHVSVAAFDAPPRYHGNPAELDFSMDYGLPGQPGYRYERPFDHFQFQATLSTADGLENLTSNGLLWGAGWHVGDTLHGVAGFYGTYEYLAPQVYHVSTTALSLGTTAQWATPLPHLALQGSVEGGFGYAAASSTIRDVNSAEYHYGMAPRVQGSLRVIDDSRWSLDVGARLVSLGTIASRDAGRDTISRVETAFTWRLFGHQAVGVNYVWSHRSASFATAPERKQTLGQVGIFWTWLGQDDFGRVATRR